jgi:glycosyltransferase involved in cell wall biosynthesis
MAAVYKTIDILVQSSLGEGLPMTLLEAMSLGKPIIATDVGATSELIHNNETGLLIPRGSSADLAAALRTLLKDESLRKRCGENARRVVGVDFSLEKMLSSYRMIYEDVLTYAKY